jgi:hypothetical protein
MTSKKWSFFERKKVDVCKYLWVRASGLEWHVPIRSYEHWLLMLQKRHWTSRDWKMKPVAQSNQSHRC